MTAVIGTLATIGSTVSMGAATGTTAAAIGGATVAAGAAGVGMSAYSGISGYQQGKAQARDYKNAADAALAQSRAQAAEFERQARHENIRAGIEQIGAEQEAEKRSRILAQDIGSMYANFAGNGLALDGTAKDTVGAALRTQVGEAQSDISTIRDNAAMTVWTHEANAASHRASAANALIAGRNQARVYRRQAKAARAQGRAALTKGLIQAGVGAAGLGLGLYGAYGSYASSLANYAGASTMPGGTMMSDPTILSATKFSMMA